MIFDNGLYFSASQFYKQKFGTKVYKISIDAGTTCPNRDGTKGKGGCIFCSLNGSGEFSQNKNLSIPEQIENAKKIVSSKIKNGKFIAYFQNFSNTYGDMNQLEQKYIQAAVHKDIVAVSIATRPDCINDNIIAVLKRLSKITFVIVELGLQTSSEKTGFLINRCYSNKDYENAVLKLKTVENIHIVTHIIFGLPFETEENMLSTVKFAVLNKTDGIKITVLYVVKNTVLEKMLLNNEFKVLQMEEYFSLIKKALKLIPENVVIHRLTGDGDKKTLIAPDWTRNKKNVLNAMTKYLKE